MPLSGNRSFVLTIPGLPTGENKDRFAEAHQQLITRSGVYNHENLDLSALAKDKVYEFVYVFAPLRLKGATGSPGNPFAVR
jgi:kynurenine formamidase